MVTRNREEISNLKKTTILCTAYYKVYLFFKCLDGKNKIQVVE